MCGIFGYLGPVHGGTSEVVQALLTGLRRLEYRGYDSAGIAFDANDIVVIKEVGNIASLEHKVEKMSQDLPTATTTTTTTTCGIAHTRWATHGVPSTANSHPQVSEWENLEFVVVHNGIITNYRALKEFLSKQGVAFESETDTEVIPKLCKYIYDRLPSEKCSFRELVSQVVGELEGAFALLFKSSLYPGELVGCKCGSPLLLGIKKEQGGNNKKPTDDDVQFYFASDASAIIEHTKRVVVMEDNDVVHLKDGGYSTYSLDRAALTETNRVLQTLEIGVEQIMKGGYDHFMQKEIHEQPEALVETMRGRVMLQGQHDSNGPVTSLDSPRTLMASVSSRSSLEGITDSPFSRPTPLIKLGGLEDHLESIIRSRRIIFIACGTSFHACLAARQLVEELTGIPVTLELASDLLDRQGPLFRDDTCIFVSQSGETADTLNCLHYAKSKGSLCVGITNTVGSSISRETACGVHVNAGCEIGVASTKAYTCQIVVIIMIALKLSEDSVRRSERRREIMNDLLDLPEMLKKILGEEQLIKDLAQELVNEQSLLVFGRGYNYATALEVALKVKEVSLMHSEGILAGELKHGPLALIDEYMPAVVVATRDSLREKMWSTIQQLLARKGRLILLVSRDDQDMANSFSSNKSLRIIKVDTVCDCLQPILNIVPFQLLSYHLTVLRGFNVDQPRNLAKSVTVE
jgi:glucosamine--fructose-6-phosphate aminotransferase (isomerizing)